MTELQPINAADARLDTRRLTIFLACAFGIAWAIALIIYLTGGIVNSPQLIPGSGITLALVLMAVGYMWAPALGHIITRLVTREGWQGTLLRPQLRRGWRFWLVAWLMPALLSALGAAIYFAVFPSQFDPSLGTIRASLERAQQISGQTVPFSPWAIVALQIVVGVLAAPLINSLFTFGEEFGWRAYLLPKLLPLGERRALLLLGVIWGVWHWPVIAMGHNYGLGYAGWPWLGMLAMVWFTVMCGIFLGWLTLRAGSVWPAVIGHAATNGIAALGLLFAQGQPNMLLGPSAAGVIGALPWAAVALWMMLRPPALAAPRQLSGAPA